MIVDMRTAILSALVLLPSIAAQGRTIIVDQANGPGTDFLDVPAAVAAASDGDILRLRPGSYSGVTTGKALTIVGPTSASIGQMFGQALLVDRLGPGKTFAVQGIELRRGLFPVASPTVQGCQGRVLFDRVRIVDPRTFGGGIALVIQDSINVHCNGCTFRGRGGVGAVTSTVSLTNCEVSSVDGAADLMHLAVVAAGGVASTFFLAQTSVTGGNEPGLPAGSQAFWARDSTVTIAGDSTSVLRAGASGGSQPVSGIELLNSALTIDPAVRVIASHGAPPILGANVTSRRLAALRVDGAPIGATINTTLYSTPGELVLRRLGRLVAPPS